MTHNWKPGDAAVGNIREAFLPNYGVHETGRVDAVVIYQRSGWILAADADYFWPHTGASIHNPRPLVVIDPEDREQRERLAKALVEAIHASGRIGSAAVGVHPDEVATALREFANPTPPKPEEPTGLGAVVRDSRDVTWIRVYRDGGPAKWHRSGAGEPYAVWSAIDAVEVLSAGWSA